MTGSAKTIWFAFLLRFTFIIRKVCIWLMHATLIEFNVIWIVCNGSCMLLWLAWIRLCYLSCVCWIDIQTLSSNRTFRLFDMASDSSPFLLAALIWIHPYSFDALDSFAVFFFFLFIYFLFLMKHKSLIMISRAFIRLHHAAISPLGGYQSILVFETLKENYICIYFKKSHDTRI